MDEPYSIIANILTAIDDIEIREEMLEFWRKLEVLDGEDCYHMRLIAAGVE